MADPEITTSRTARSGNGRSSSRIHSVQLWNSFLLSFAIASAVLIAASAPASSEDQKSIAEKRASDHVPAPPTLPPLRADGRDTAALAAPMSYAMSQTPWRDLVKKLARIKAKGGCPKSGDWLQGRSYVAPNYGAQEGPPYPDGIYTSTTCSLGFETYCGSGRFLLPWKSVWAVPGGLALTAAYAEALARTYAVPDEVIAPYTRGLRALALEHIRRGRLASEQPLSRNPDESKGKDQANDHSDAENQLLFDLERGLASSFFASGHIVLMLGGLSGFWSNTTTNALRICLVVACLSDSVAVAPHGVLGWKCVALG